MSLAVVSRAALLTAASWAALAGAAAAQDGPRPTELDEVIVTGAPYGISARATTIATTVIGEEALASAPASSQDSASWPSCSSHSAAPWQ